MNLFKFYAWLYDEANLKVYVPTEGEQYQGAVVGGILNYPARSFVVDIKFDKFIYRVICSSKDGCLAVTVKATALFDPEFVVKLGELLDNKLQDYVARVNKFMTATAETDNITISFSARQTGNINIQLADRTAQNLTYGEALGLLAQLLPCDKQNLNWLQSEQDRKELAERDARHHGNEGHWP